MNSASQSNGGVIGILLAAGRGRRMGTTKQLLSWPPLAKGRAGGKTVVAAAFDAIAPFCCDMIVVLGHEASGVMSALAPRSYRHVMVDPDAPMLASIMAGLSLALERSGSAALIHPADQPAVASATIQLIIDRAKTEPRKIIMPEFNGKGGHPVLIPRGHWPSIMKFEGDGGLRTLWIQMPEDCLRIPVDDQGAVKDLDSPGDYESGRENSSGGS